MPADAPQVGREFRAAPLLMFHGSSRLFGRPNSSKAVAQAQIAVDIVELDVRKSRDGILYCYHGGLGAFLLRFLSWRMIRGLLDVERLSDVLRVVEPARVVVFLDLKDSAIALADLERATERLPNPLWLACWSTRHLARLRAIKSRPQTTLVFNFGFLRFESGVVRAKAAGADIVKIFPWQCGAFNVNLLESVGMRHAIFGAASRPDLVRRWGTVWLVAGATRSRRSLEWLRQREGVERPCRCG